LEVAKLFWQEKKIEKARKFLKQAVSLDKDNGDTWGYLALFEQSNPQGQNLETLMKDFVEADPCHGNLWP